MRYSELSFIALSAALSLLIAGCEMQGMSKSSGAVAMSESQVVVAPQTVFKNTVYALATAKCASCHVGNDSYPFADPDSNYAYQITKTLVDFNHPENSTLVAAIDDGHCGPECAGPNTETLENDISTWAKSEGYTPVIAASPSPSPSP